MSPPDTAAATYYEGAVELAVYENDAEDYTPNQRDGGVFRLSRRAAERLRADLVQAISECDEAFRGEQQELRL